MYLLRKLISVCNQSLLKFHRNKNTFLAYKFKKHVNNLKNCKKQKHV